MRRKSIIFFNGRDRDAVIVVDGEDVVEDVTAVVALNVEEADRRWC